MATVGCQSSAVYSSPSRPVCHRLPSSSPRQSKTSAAAPISSYWVSGEGNLIKHLNKCVKVLGRTGEVNVGKFRARHGRLDTSLRFNGGKPKHRNLRVYAKADDSAPSEMSLETALKLLGVREGASFDEILQAKKSLMDKSAGDQERVSQVEAAYDALLMQRLMKRRSGEVADSSVLYADVRSRSLASNKKGGGLTWLKGAFKSLPVDVATPPATVLTTQTAVYGALMTWTYVSGFTSFSGEPSIGPGADATGVTLALGFGASIYFLRQQNLKLGKAAAITTAGLVAGALVGNVVESWLRVDIVPVVGFSSPAVMVSEFVLLSLWLVSLYLR